jgi:RING-H2 zinc finger domain/RING-like zinc finger
MAQVITLTTPSRPSPVVRQPLEESIEARQDLLFVAIRWGFFAIMILVLSVLSIFVVDIPASCASYSRQFTTMAIWTGVSTTRFLFGASLWISAYRAFDVTIPASLQHDRLYKIIRWEFSLTLLGAMWAILGLLYFASGASSVCPGSNSFFLYEWCLTLISLQLLQFVSPIIFGIILRAANSSDNFCLIRFVERILLISILRQQYQTEPIAASRATIQSIPEEKYRHGRFGRTDGPPLCAICLSEFQDGEAIRILPCGGNGRSSVNVSQAPSSGEVVTDSSNVVSYSNNWWWNRRSPSSSSAAAPSASAPSSTSEEYHFPHVFHKACVDQWLSQNGTCPVCRASVRARSNTMSQQSTTTATTMNETAAAQSMPPTMNNYA